MDNNLDDKLIKKMMTGSRLIIDDPSFDDSVISGISTVFYRRKRKKLFLLNFFIITVIELVVFSIVWLLFIFYPGSENINNILNDFIYLLREVGNLVIDYAYLIIAILVGVLVDWVMNHHATASSVKIM
jgi:uncharacterized membrane protein